MSDQQGPQGQEFVSNDELQEQLIKLEMDMCIHAERCAKHAEQRSINKMLVVLLGVAATWVIAQVVNAVIERD